MAFRRERTQLTELIERSKEVLRPLGYHWHEQDKYFRGPKGGRLRFSYLENDSDADGYQGHSYTRLYPEEMGTFPSESPINKLQATLRSGNGVPCQMKGTCNPGGPGHQWVKARYRLGEYPNGFEVFRYEFTNPFTKSKIERTRVFIPSKVSDNKFLGDDYVAGLYQVGSENLVRAWLLGDWSVIEGAFFDGWSPARHIVAPFHIPDNWVRIRAMDWGYAKPFSVGWWAVAADPMTLPSGQIIPRGCMVCYREWYGKASANVGLRIDAEEVAAGIKDRETGEKMDNAVLDPSAFAQNGGPSLAERMYTSHRVGFRAADNTRVGKLGAVSGWDGMRARLRGDEDGNPMIVFFSTCTDSIRTIPALQHDTLRAEDIDCWVGETLVSTPSGPRQIKDIGIGDCVDTPIGPRPVLRSYLSGSSVTMRVTLSDGTVLEGTPHHKIMIQGHGLIALNKLECYMIPKRRIIWQSGLNIAVSFIRAMRDGSTTIRAALSSVTAALACTVKCGSMQAALSPMAGTSTISTETTITTNCRTSSAFPPAIMGGTICKNASLVSLDNGSRLGVGQRPDRQHYARMLARWSPARLNGNARADIVASLLLPSTLLRSFVPTPARRLFQTLHARFAASRFGASLIRRAGCAPVHITAVGRSEEKTAVYNLTVADAHLFYANGVLSSNTDGEDHAADQVRYACNSRPWVRQSVPAKKPVTQQTMTMNDLWRARARDDAA